jgi:hypothetical protein
MILKRCIVLGLKSAHGLRRAGEAGPCAVARRPTVRPNSHPARPAWARRGARAPPVVTALWPHARRRAGAASGIQPGDEVWGIRRGQLTQKEGEVLSKVKPARTYRGSVSVEGYSDGRWRPQGGSCDKGRW